MQTDRPTTTLYFVFAFTYCKLEVYDTEIGFAKKILILNGAYFINKKHSTNWQTIDTRILLNLTKKVLLQLVKVKIDES
jgi:hypothetical protein